MVMGSQHLCSKLQALSSKIKQASVNGKWREVLCGYSEIQRAGIQFNDPFVFPIVFKACAKLSWLFQGRCIQASLLKRGFESFASVGNSIADFYMKCGDLCSAIREFDCMTSRDSVSWNVIVFGLLDHGFEEEGLWWFSKSRAWGFEPNVSTLVLVIHACRSFRSYVDGEKVHSYMIRSGFWGISSVQNSILCLYAECDFSSARKLFDEMSDRDVISWSVVIRSYVQSHEPVLGLKLFQEMVREAKTEPDCVTVTNVLKACAVLEDIDVGRSIHGFSIRKGFDLADVFVCNSLIDMYSKGFDVDSAFRVFDEMTTCRNIVSWNSILAGFVHNQRYDEAHEIFRLMRKEGIEADEVTLVSLLQVCKFLKQPLPCKAIHCVIIRHGYESNEVALSSLIDACTSCNLVDDARTVLDSMTYKDVVSCSTMISALARSGRPDEAISIFCQMRNKPNAITVISLLNACSVSADLRKSKWAHGIAIRRGLAINDISVDTSIVDAYAKCGAIELARRTFNQIPRKNVVSWTVIISAYAINGLPDKALASFDEMKREGYTPNAVTYLAALSACNHGGLINKGLMIFKSLVEDHKPSLQHYSCIVDMLSRAGEIDTAMELIKNLPEDLKAGASAWGAILSGCRNRLQDGIITSEAVAEVLELEPLCSSGYLLASSAFAAEKSWDNVAMMRRLVKERKVRVVAGYSTVLEGSLARRFLAGDKLSHSDSELNDVVQSLHRCMTLDYKVGP